MGDQKEIYSALLNAKKRGVKIRAVSDFSRNLIETYSFSDEFNKDFNAVLDKTSSLMHNKFFIFDNKVVMSGSLNISATGSGGYNSNSAVFIYDENIAKVYSEEFNQMYNSKFSKEKNSSNFKQDNSIIKAYFSPKDNVYNNVLKQKILNAKKSIYVSAFYLTDKDMINDLISVSNKGIEVLIILDATSANNFKELVHKMRSSNIKLIVENWGGKNHEKTIAIDDDTLIIGSCNFSKSGFYKNDENILVFKNSSMTKFYKDYYLYLFNSIDKKYLISIPRAEGVESINSCNDGIDNNFDGKIDNKDEACKIN